MSGQNGSRRTSARFATESSGGRSDSARRCVQKWRCRVSAIRHGSAEHPRDNSAPPFVESNLERLNRCAVVQDLASDDADERLRDATDRRWLAESAPTLPSIGARAIARTATTHGQRGGSAYRN